MNKSMNKSISKSVNDAHVEQWTNNTTISRQYGIGQFRYIPGKKRISNAARIGIVRNRPLIITDRQLHILRAKISKENRKAALIGQDNNLDEFIENIDLVGNDEGLEEFI